MVKIRIQIKTPKGHAQDVEQSLRPWLLQLKRPDVTAYNDDDSEIGWILQCSPREYVRIRAGVNMFHKIMKDTLNNPLVKHFGINKLKSEKEKQTFREMINNQTEVEIVSEATAQELAENSKSVFSRLKE
jgi:hypothetical protein